MQNELLAQLQHDQKKTFFCPLMQVFAELYFAENPTLWGGGVGAQTDHLMHFTFSPK
jgi:hypothetical protein